MLGLMLTTLLTASSAKPIISVVYFDNLTRDPGYDVMRKGLAEMIITDLVAWDGVTVVERDRLESVLTELALQRSKAFDPATAVKVGKLMGASYSLTGSMLLDQKSGRLRVDALLRSVEKGDVVIEAHVEDRPDALFDLEQALVEKLIAGLDSKLTANATARRKVRVPNLEAAKLFSEALDLSDQGKLEAAQAAMRAVVSKAPSFLLARERQQQLLARFQDYEKRKRDLVTDSVLELAKRVDEVLASAASFDTLPQPEVNHVLTARVLKGRFIIRAAKQFFSSHDAHTRVAKRGQEAKAVLAQRAWVDNQSKLIDEVARAKKRFPTFFPSKQLDAAETKLVLDAQFGDVSLGDPFSELMAFVLHGAANDGESCHLFPTVGAIDPKEQKAVLRELDERLARALEHAKAEPRAVFEPFVAARERADVAIDDGDVDLAVSSMQKVLDVFPTAPQASDFERRIKELLEGRGVDERALRWSKGLKSSCADHMDLIVGISAADRRWLAQAGLKGVDDQLAALDRACPAITDTTLLGNFARLYATHDDCEASMRLWGRYLHAGGSVRDLMGWARNQSWCSPDQLLADVPWFHATYDGNWDLEFVKGLTSSLAGNRLTLSGIAARPTMKGRQDEPFSLSAERTGDGWTCTSATWAKGPTLTGSCSVTVTHLAAKPGEFDEGTFGADFVDRSEGYGRKLGLTKGVFKLRRQ
jgi:TolB-like protein